ncbi:uncharacterized protein LOC141632082 [Silene latifolia]|uniref:uncharacterized protein LOC141632082 n=1 Tax=Silene latifolia TaxID=37657 RepID=UPI003D7836BF
MIYAFNNIHERAPLWDHLRRIAGLVDGPWAIAGDFNCVLSAAERVGGNTPTAEIDPFRTCVLDCGIVDIPAIGSLFTWNNMQRPEDRIYSKIDRFMTNKAWSDHFPDLYANFLPEGMLDHTPCLISSSTQVQKVRSFKYYNMWGASKEFLPTITRYWSNSILGTPLFRLTKNLKLLKPALKALNRKNYSDIENNTAIMQRRVADLQELIGKDPTNLQLISEEFEASKTLRELSAARDSFLAQKAKTQWLQKRDSNSAYFHYHYVQLARPVTGKEIRDVLFSIPGIKSPGLMDIRNQGAFIQNRSIQENILICQDLIRLYERPNATPRCMFKIDLQKAYDTVEWSFVEQLLDEFHFPDDFKTMVLQCISTASFSLSLNGDMFGYFQGKRGRRQGDPLSPLLFTLCMEYLTRTLKYAANKFDFKYHPLCKELKLANLMFADDVLLFSRGDAHSMMLLLKSFSTFSNASGLKVSATKSNAYFQGVPEHIKQDILRVSGFVEGQL